MKPTTWEYRVERAPGAAALNELGAQGWEVVSATQVDVFLKRPALDFREQVTLDQRRRYFGYWGLEVPEEKA
ncbi:MAG: hypothetical protein IT335_14125 [Thermomicrobiales bacterium]|jgi:hypothetical protein|nr:hypothetical protein [Thermomicrobiales bacterium]